MQIMAADGYLSESQCAAQPGQPVSFNVAGTRFGIQVIPPINTGPRVVVPTNNGTQALARQRVVARPLVYPDRPRATSVATTNGPSFQVSDLQMLIDFQSDGYRLFKSHPWIEIFCVTVWLETANSHLRKLSLLAIIIGVLWKDACDKILQCDYMEL